MINRNEIVLLLLMFFVLGCTKKDTDYSIKTKKVGAYTFGITLETLDEKSVDFLLELNRNDELDLIRYDNNQQLIQSRIYNYSYKFKNGIFLEQGDQQYPASFCHFERSFGLKKSRVLLFSYDRSNIELAEPFWVVIDSDMLDTGPVKFKYHINMPNLSI